MKRVSLLARGEYNSDWISDFYDPAHHWWGDDPLDHLEVDGNPLDFRSNRITPAGPLMDAWSYLVRLRPIER